MIPFGVMRVTHPPIMMSRRVQDRIFNYLQQGGRKPIKYFIDPVSLAAWIQIQQEALRAFEKTEAHPIKTLRVVGEE